MTPWITLLGGLLLGVILGVWLGSQPRGPHLLRRAPKGPEMPSSAEHVLDLLRRVYGATAVCLVWGDAEPVVAGAPEHTRGEGRDRLISMARLAMGDGREHVERTGAVLVAVGDRKRGAAVLLESGELPEGRIEDIASDLRRLLGDFERDATRAGVRYATPARVATELPPSLDTLPAIASGLCDRARIITGRPTAVVVRAETTETASIIAVSHNGDRRLLGAPVAPDSAVGRACLGSGTVTAGSSDELFGRSPDDRRSRSERGTAYPLRDGNKGVGALVVFGTADDMDPVVKERLMWLAVDSGPRFAAAAAVQAAEQRPSIDALTGLDNRKAFDEAMANASDGPCAVLCVDIDHFKKINDSFGHAAGDATLKHLARIFRAALRDSDMAARIGSEDFVLWLPETNRAAALDVAERVRRAVAETPWMWAGDEIELTCSIGVAARPATATRLQNLVPAAEAALSHAKQAGRNRVEEAQPTA